MVSDCAKEDTHHNITDKTKNILLTETIRTILVHKNTKKSTTLPFLILNSSFLILNYKKAAGKLTPSRHKIYKKVERSSDYARPPPLMNGGIWFGRS